MWRRSDDCKFALLDPLMNRQVGCRLSARIDSADVEVGFPEKTTTKVPGTALRFADLTVSALLAGGLIEVVHVGSEIQVRSVSNR